MTVAETEEIEITAPASEMVSDELMEQSHKALTSLVETQSLLRQEIKTLSTNNDNDDLANVIIAINSFMAQVNASVSTATVITILFTQSRIIDRQNFKSLHERCKALILENEKLKAEIKAVKSEKKNAIIERLKNFFNLTKKK